MIRVPRFGGPNNPAFIMTGEKPKPDAEPREELGRMMTADPQFARDGEHKCSGRCRWDSELSSLSTNSILPRLDPKTTPQGWQVQASHPELLEALAKDFRDSNYSLKHLFATICKSNAYQLSARFDGEWKDSYTKYYARHFRQNAPERRKCTIPSRSLRIARVRLNTVTRRWAWLCKGVGRAETPT